MVVKIVEYPAQKMKFSIKDFCSKYDQIRSLLRIWSHVLKKSLMENFTFSAVYIPRVKNLKQKNDFTFRLIYNDLS